MSWAWGQSGCECHSWSNQAIKKAFEKIDLLTLLDTFFVLSSDGTSVNSGKKTGLISLCREEKEWVTFSYMVFQSLSWIAMEIV